MVSYQREWRKNNVEKSRGYGRKHYYKYRDKCLAYSNEYKRTHPEQVKDKTRRYNLAHPDYQHDYYMANKEHCNSKSKAYSLKLKHEVIAAYGGKCVCCGLNEWMFLTIDHIDKKNREVDRDANGKNITGYRLYMILRKLRYPQEGYRCLCFNCNCVRGVYGFCPHERQKVDFLEVVA